VSLIRWSDAVLLVFRDTEDGMLNMDAHTKFVTGWLEKLRMEEKK
jgi:hypothetical protein